MRFAFVCAAPAWRGHPEALTLMRRAARAARDMARREGRAAIGPVTVLLADDARLAVLNGAFRGPQRPTNVLSFPSSEPAYGGDIAIAYQTVAREAKEQDKDFAAHAAHLAAHGVLHLMGYDHETETEAEAMEGLERRVMAGLGLADPYAPPGKAA